MTRAAGLAAVTALAASTACAHHAPPPAASPADDAILTITSNRPDAEIVIDGHVVGRVSRQVKAGMAIEPGHHQLELRRDDFFSAYLDLELARGERKALALDLQPILP